MEIISILFILLFFMLLFGNSKQKTTDTPPVIKTKIATEYKPLEIVQTKDYIGNIIDWLNNEKKINT